MNHQIELMPGLRPLAQAPYRMTPPKLIELKEAIDKVVGYGLGPTLQSTVQGTCAILEKVR